MARTPFAQGRADSLFPRPAYSDFVEHAAEGEVVKPRRRTRKPQALFTTVATIPVLVHYAQRIQGISHLPFVRPNTRRDHVRPLEGSRVVPLSLVRFRDSVFVDEIDLAIGRAGSRFGIAEECEQLREATTELALPLPIVECGTSFEHEYAGEFVLCIQDGQIGRYLFAHWRARPWPKHFLFLTAPLLF